MNVTSFKVGITEAVGEGRSPSYAKVELEVSVYPGESYEEAKKKAFAELKLAQNELQKDMVSGGTKPAPKEPVKKKVTKKEEEEKTPAKEEKEAPAKEAPQPKKEVKKKKAPAKKNTPYNREDKEHKKEVRSILSEHCPGWKEDDDLKATAKSASVALNGSDLLDSDGNILESFVNALKEKMEDADV